MEGGATCVSSISYNKASVKGIRKAMLGEKRERLRREGNIKIERDKMQIEVVELEQKNFSVYIFSSARYINRNLQPAQPLLPQWSESSALGSKVRFTSELTLFLSLSFYFSLSILKGVGKAEHHLLEAPNINLQRQQMLDLMPCLGAL